MSEETSAYLCAGIMAIAVLIYAVILIFFKDIAWKFQDFNNRTRGVQSERTEDWERFSTMSGVILIGFIVFMFMLVISQ